MTTRMQGTMERLREEFSTETEWIVQRVLSRVETGSKTFSFALKNPILRNAVIRINGLVALVLDKGEAADPLVGQFGREQASLHRKRGITLVSFMTLLKHFRDTYRELMVRQDADRAGDREARLGLIDRMFDNLEFEVLTEWPAEIVLAAPPETGPGVLADESLVRYRQIFESIAAPIVLIDDAGVIDDINAAARDLFVGPSVPGAVYYGEGEMPYLSEDLVRFVREFGEEERCERVMHTRHGIRQFEVAVIHLTDESGTFAGSMTLFEDVTRRTEIEETLQREKDRLEDLVAMRTAEVNTTMARLREEEVERKAIEESLHKTIDQLTKSNTELERFANFASHDLKESARLVASYAELISRRLGDGVDSSMREFLSFLAESGKRMSRQVEDLLAYSRTQTRVHPFADVDARRIVTAALGNLDDDIRESAAEVQIRPLPIVWCDEFQIQEVFQHLIGNAIKFRHPDRTPVIEIGADISGDEAVLFMRDNGIGIDPLFADQIFVIFKRLHTKDMYPGSGIGLALCKRIVERHGGRIWLDTSAGDATVFRFSLPLADPQARPATTRRAAR